MDLATRPMGDTHKGGAKKKGAATAETSLSSLLLFLQYFQISLRIAMSQLIGVNSIPIRVRTVYGRRHPVPPYSPPLQALSGEKSHLVPPSLLHFEYSSHPFPPLPSLARCHIRTSLSPSSAKEVDHPASDIHTHTCKETKAGK